MSHLKCLTLLVMMLSLSLLTACAEREAANDQPQGSGPASEEAETQDADPVALMGDGSWTVRQFGYEVPIAGSTITLERFEPGRIAGLASCNRYNATVTREGDGIRILPPASTLMACPDEALAEQEQRFLEALTEVESIELARDGQLVMRLSTQGEIRARQYVTE